MPTEVSPSAVITQTYIRLEGVLRALIAVSLVSTEPPDNKGIQYNT